MMICGFEARRSGFWEFQADILSLAQQPAVALANDGGLESSLCLKEQTEQTMRQGAANPPPFLGPSTRARMFTFLVGHTWDIYGQMAVYLRLNGLVPPASQRP